jgi:hypothetical protein
MSDRRAALFTGTSFLAAFLLFLVQPMVAKLVLPAYGGSAAVWNTSNAFFQTALLGGYAYSHVLTRRVVRRRQATAHLLVLALPLAVLPLALPQWAAPPEDRAPALWLVLVLIVAIGLPFFAVATSGPLLQRWFSHTDHPKADDPYFLYAAGNVGSFSALLLYPVLLEPNWSVVDQARGWALAYVALAVLVATCGFVARPAAGARDAATLDDVEHVTPAPSRRTRLRWVVLAAIPASLMLGVTSFITADLAAVPLLWVLPLSLYLATFVVAFGRPADRPMRVAPVLLGGSAATVAVAIATSADVPVGAAVVAHLVLFTTGAYVAHRALSLDRPAPDRLTGFYLVVALGGVVGGAVNAFVAPVVFDRVVEYPLAISAAAALGLLAVVNGGRRGLRARYGPAGIAVEAALGFAVVSLAARATGAGTAGLVVVAVALLAGVAVGWGGRWVPAIGLGAALVTVAQVVAPLPQPVLLESRTFFGVYRVERDGDQTVFVSGSTVHGAQDPDDPGEPLTYYTRQGPAGQLMDLYGAGDGATVALVGLGVGSLAAYGHDGQTFEAYEIDPEVVRIARDSGHFTFLTDTEAATSYHVGDGRLELAERSGPPLDLLVLDAFSGDSIPVHLLTVEAFDLYQQQLADGGAIAVHISNRYLDLRPVVAGAADALGLATLVRRDPPGADETDGSWWAVVAADEATLAPLADDERWRPTDEAGVEEWTDERSNLLAVLGVDPPG